MFGAVGILEYRESNRQVMDETFHCEQCDQDVERAAATRTKTMGDLDPSRWQTMCCPDCGGRLKTVYVGNE